MRKLIIPVIITLFSICRAHAGDEAWRLGFIQKIGSSASFTLGGTVVSVPITLPVLPGMSIVCANGTNGNTTLSSVSDTSGNVWNIDQSATSGIGAGFFISRSNVRYYLPLGSTITAVQAGSFNDRLMACYRVSGIVSIDTAGTNSVPTTGSGNWSAGTVKNTQADDLVFGGSLDNASVVVNSAPTAGVTELDDFSTPDAVCMTTAYLIANTPQANTLSGTWGSATHVLRSGEIAYKAGGRKID